MARARFEVAHVADLVVDVRIARPPAAVYRWWTEFPEVYENEKEQPHRIVTRSRSEKHIDTLTYWRRPFGGELEVPERFTLRPDGWDVDIELPMGLSQRDVFRLTPDDDGTKVHIEVDVWARSFAGRLARPAFMLYARRSYPRTWRAAVRWCERATS